MRIAVITLSTEGAAVATRLVEGLPDADVFLHESVGPEWQGRRFKSIVSLTKDIFNRYQGLVYVAPCGVVVRALAPNIKHKTRDPGVVAVDVCARYAISVLSGHEGGANDLAMAVGNIIGAEPIVTTTTEAKKNLIVGIGCRRGTPAARIIEAIKAGLDEANASLDQVRVLASADLKADEEGLIDAARELGLPLRLIPSDEIRNSTKRFQRSDFVQEKVNLPAVAEPSALLAGRRTKLVLRKKKFSGVTVAVARENCLW
ncbi:MAG: cobalamin biosynthesis protein [Desulfomonile tiedjei]|nr:cobalamin biosynthesis protein [Desulfomonile tiedjei]